MSTGQQSTLKSLADLTAPLSTDRGLPNAAYWDPAVFDLERETVLGGTWAAIAHGGDLPLPRSAKPVDFMGAPLLLVRDRDGELRVFHNVCSHRGMLLVHEAGRLANVLRCPYHSWSYDFRGNLVSTPLIGGPERNTCDGFERSRHGLKAVRFAIWMDIVFVNLSGDAPPFEAFIAPLERRWARYLGNARDAGFEPGTTDSRMELQAACNWKLAVENYCEAYHLPWVHPGLNSYSPLDRHYNIAEHDGMAGQGTEQYNSPSAAEIEMPTVVGWPSEALSQAEYIALFPNTLLGVQADHFFSLIICPEAPNRSSEKVQIALVGAAASQDRYAAGRLALLESWKAVFREDVFAVEGLQAGRRSPGFGGGVLTPVQDAPTHRFHRWVAERYPRTGG